MLILSKKIILPDDASLGDIEDAKLTADLKGWEYKHVTTSEERFKATNLDNKCGSCMYFQSHKYCGSKAYGDCSVGHAWGQRTRPACKDYRRVE